MYSRISMVKALVVIAVAAGCGGSSSSSSHPGTPGFYISISNLSFSPLNLHAPAGATVTVINNDSIAHTVTSGAMPGAFTPGSVAGVSFDTGPFTGTASFTLASGVAQGTVIPFYCSVHKGTMNTPNGAITIDDSAMPAPPPGGGGGTGY